MLSALGVTGSGIIWARVLEEAPWLLSRDEALQLCNMEQNAMLCRSDAALAFWLSHANQDGSKNLR